MRDALLFIAIISVLALFALFYYRNYSYTTYSLDTETTLGALSGTRIYQIDSGNVIIGGDTITYMENGITVWSTPVDLKKPVVAVNGDFFSVYDTGGYQVYVCDTTGILSTLKVSRVIHGMDIAENGVVAVFTASDDSAYISYFDRYGSRIPVEVKSVLSATGYPMHLAISPDAQKLLVLYYSTANGIGESRLVLYDFEKGREDESYIVYSDDSFYDSGTLLLQGKFLDNEHIVAVGDKQTKFLYYDRKKKEVSDVTLDYGSQPKSVFFTADAFGILSMQEEGMVCTLYEPDGSLRYRFNAPAEYQLFTTDRESIAFLNASDLTVYNLSGRKRYEGTIVDQPVSFAFSGKRSLLFNTGSLIEEITLK